MTKRSTTLKKSKNEKNEGLYLKKWQIGIILAIICSSYGLFWHFHVMVVESKDAVIDGKETTIGMLNTLLDNCESYKRWLYDQNKELIDIYEKRNVTSPLSPPIPLIENVSNDYKVNSTHFHYDRYNWSYINR